MSPSHDRDNVSGMEPRFQPGDHLQVQRPWLYFHHGIYVRDDRVIQFGSGISLLDKGGTSINAVTLADFEKGSRAAAVRHGYESWFTGHHPAADEPWKIIERAEFLLKLQPRLRYNLIGHNCEIIANMCASGSWTESYQVRRFFGVRVAVDMALMLWLGGRERAKRSVPGWVLLMVAGGVVVGFGVKYTYDDQIRRLWKEIRADWQAHEHQLDEDPRNGLST